MPFGGLRVLSLESRRAKEMETLIRREGGDPFVAPSVQERALDDHREALGFVDRLEAGEFDLVVCMTGAGLAFLRDLAAADSAARHCLAAGLRKTFIVSRGPKPVPILRELGARAQIVVPEPNTWKEVVEAVASRPERRIAVQEYGRPNPRDDTPRSKPLARTVTPFAIYRWDLPADLEPLREAARRLAAREIDVVLFTSSIQLDHLFQIAQEHGHCRRMCGRSLAQYAAVASVGPDHDRGARSGGLARRVIPIHPKMAALVKASSDLAGEALIRKRQLHSAILR